MLQIITAPHPVLRQPAQPLDGLATKNRKFIDKLGETLLKKKDPPGVGLASPQVAVSKRIFYTCISSNTKPAILELYINPVITDHSDTHLFGETASQKKPRLEGCLSIPGIYGAVPRWEWVDITYQTIGADGQLMETSKHANNFEARVIQHELDHLEGILFTDYSLQQGLPIYTEDEHGELVEVDLSSIAHL